MKLACRQSAQKGSLSTVLSTVALSIPALNRIAVKDMKEEGRTSEKAEECWHEYNRMGKMTKPINVQMGECWRASRSSGCNSPKGKARHLAVVFDTNLDIQVFANDCTNQSRSSKTNICDIRLIPLDHVTVVSILMMSHESQLDSRYEISSTV